MASFTRALSRARLSSSASPFTPLTSIHSRANFSTTLRRDLARIQIIGRLAATPELTPTSTGREVLTYALGVNTGPKDEQGNRATSWFRVASFSEIGRDTLLNLKKGTKVFVDADAEMKTYADAQGNNRTALNLIQRSFEILERRGDDETAAPAE